MNENEIKKYQLIGLVGGFILHLVISSTFPTINVYMIKHISTDFFKITVLIESIVSFVIYYIMNKRDSMNNLIILEKIRTHFVKVLIFSNIIYVTANIAGISVPEIRFLILSSFDCIAMCLWDIIMSDLWNNILEKSEITDYNNRQRKYNTGARILGAGFAVLTDFNIVICLVLQSIAFLVLSISDYIVYKGLFNKAYNKE